MNKSQSLYIYFAATCGLLASVGDFIVTFTLGALFPGYDFIQHSESFLGTSASPVAIYMNAWGVIFFILLVIFAWGLRKSFFQHGKWQLAVVVSLILYGLGEGAGSGLFPYNHDGAVLTLSGKFHSFFGVIGGIALVIIPFACYKIFDRASYQILKRYSVIVFVAGIILIVLFLLSERGLVSYRGLLQRIYILNYHIFLAVIALVMIRHVSANDKFNFS